MDTSTAQKDMSDALPDERTPAYSWYALGVIMVAYIFAFIDRQMLNLLVEPIKHDLSLSDTEMSFLQGLSFALLLSLTGLPVGRLVDTRRRTLILAAGAAIWSLATAGCGFARSYGQLLLARAGVGMGESVVTPTSLSLIGDYFPPRQTGLAVALYALGVHVGSGLALILGALVIAQIADDVVLPVLGVFKGWQLVFLVIGFPGLLTALWLTTLKEPRRGGAAGPALPPPPLREVLANLRRNGWALNAANLSVGFIFMSNYGLAAWLPSYFIRTHGWTAAEFGHLYGPVVIGAGVMGVLFAGLVGDGLRMRGVGDGRLRVMASCALLAAPLLAIAPLVDKVPFALALFGLAHFLTAAAAGSGPALLQDITPPRMRGVVHAIAVLTVNLVALGLGPTAIALFTDYVLKDEQRVGVSLALVCPLILAVAAGLALSGRKAYLEALKKL